MECCQCGKETDTLTKNKPTCIGCRCKKIREEISPTIHNDGKPINLGGRKLRDCLKDEQRLVTEAQ